jgi:hypothetical protein
MVRLAEDGYRTPAHAGRFDIAAIARAIALDLLTGDQAAQALARVLRSNDLDDKSRVELVARVLAERRFILVLDDFEQNLEPGGSAFRDPDLPMWLGLLANQARTGRLLITCRHPLPGMEHLFRHFGVGPLCPAESRKLLLRLPALAGREPAEVAMLLRVIGGHPRMLEFLDVLLRGGKARLPRVTERLLAKALEAGLDLKSAIDNRDEAIRNTILVGSRGVLLEGLLGLAAEAGDDEALQQLAVSNLPMAPAGLTRAVGGEAEGDASAADASLRRLATLSLVHRFDDGQAWVHRRTADGLARLGDVEAHRARCRRAGRYRVWRARNETHDIAEGIEAVRNFLAGQWFDEAVAVARDCLDAMRRWQQTLSVAALAGEILETLPETGGDYAAIAEAEADAHLALGLTERAFGRWQRLLERCQRLAAAEPDRPTTSATWQCR